MVASKKNEAEGRLSKSYVRAEVKKNEGKDLPSLGENPSINRHVPRPSVLRLRFVGCYHEALHQGPEESSLRLHVFGESSEYQSFSPSRSHYQRYNFCKNSDKKFEAISLGLYHCRSQRTCSMACNSDQMAGS